MNPQLALNVDRLAPSRRPAEKAIGYQHWTDLAFIHWRIDAAAIRRLLPPDLELDTWDEYAWVGLVPFHMSEVRPRWCCAVPGVSEFHETNVRTYFIHQGQPGVWFFSLEAAGKLAVWIGRWKWNLNYFHARMELQSHGSQRRYLSQRIHGKQPVNCDLTLKIKEPLPPADAEQVDGPLIGTTALPDTLEHFLVERYYLFTATPRGRLLRGQVHHPPYSLWPADVERVEETLLATAGIHGIGPPCHAMYCPGVYVEVFPLTLVG